MRFRVLLTVEGAIPHPHSDIFNWWPFSRWRQGLVESVNVEHQAVIKTSSDDVHLEEKETQKLETTRLLKWPAKETVPPGKTRLFWQCAVNYALIPAEMMQDRLNSVKTLPPSGRP